jgi:hypothetical protein
MIIEGCSSKSFESTSGASDVIVITLSTIAILDQLPSITITTINDVVQFTARRELSLSTQTTISFDVEFTVNTATTSATPSQIYDGYIKSVTASVSSGNFSSALTNSGISIFQNASVVSTSLQFSTYTVTTTTKTVSPTLSPSNNIAETGKRKSAVIKTDLLVGIVVGGFSLIVIICVLIYYYMFYERNVEQKRKNLKVFITSDSGERFLDLETIKTPEHAAKSRRFIKSRSKFNIEDIHNDDAIEPAGQIPEIFDITGFDPHPEAFHRLQRNSTQTILDQFKMGDNELEVEECVEAIGDVNEN